MRTRNCNSCYARFAATNPKALKGVVASFPGNPVKTENKDRLQAVFCLKIADLSTHSGIVTAFV
jgi:hypothetical protein